MTKLSQRAVGGSRAVIPGLPAREEPGIQRSFDLPFWIPGVAMRPGNDALRLVTNEERGCITTDTVSIAVDTIVPISMRRGRPSDLTSRAGLVCIPSSHDMARVEAGEKRRYHECVSVPLRWR